MRTYVSRSATLEERLLHYGWTVTDTGCWEWKGAVRNGYGNLWYSGKDRTTHRLAYEVWVGPIPEGPGYHGTVVRHRCDNRLCINPDHLELGTQGDNISDAESRGRAAHPRGAAHGSAVLTEEQVAFVRSAEGTHREIAQKVGVTRSTVSKIKAGRLWVETR